MISATYASLADFECCIWYGMVCINKIINKEVRIYNQEMSAKLDTGFSFFYKVNPNLTSVLYALRY